MSGTDQLISIVIPAHNAGMTLAVTLESLAGDAEVIGEIIVVDDGSEDNTAEVARKTCAELGFTLSLLRLEGRGVGAARNAGLEAVRFPLVFFLDADDLVLAGGLTKLHATLMASPQAGMSVGGYYEQDVTGARKTVIPRNYSGDLRANADNYLFGKVRPITQGSAIVRREAIGDIRFPEKLLVDEDTIFWVSIVGRTLVAPLEEPMVVYMYSRRRHALRLTNNPRGSFLTVVRAVGALRARGVSREAIQFHKTTLARIIARALIDQGRGREALRIMRVLAAHPRFAGTTRLMRYRLQARRAGNRTPGRAPAKAGDKLRTMLVTEEAIWPPLSGSDLRNTQIARAAARLGPVLTASLLPPSGTSEIPEGIEMFSATPPVGTTPRAEAVQRIANAAQSFRADAIVVSGVHLRAVMEALHGSDARLIIDMQNVESELHLQMHPPGPMQRLRHAMGRGARARLKRNEAVCLELADRAWVCSHEDCEKLARLHRPAVPIDIVPNGVPRFEEIASRGLAQREGGGGGPLILYLGHLDYRPNVDAVQRLALKILPGLRERMASASLIAAGRRPGKEVRALGAMPGVSVVADPPDVGELLETAGLTAIPLASGGGTRLKVLEAMAWGLPVVATALAVEGLGLHPGREFVQAESDEDFIREIEALWADKTRIATIRSRAYELAVHAYGPDAIARAVRRGLGFTEMARMEGAQHDAS